MVMSMEAFQNIVDDFKDTFKNVRGEVVAEMGRITFYIDSDNYSEPAKYLPEFIEFVKKYKDTLHKFSTDVYIEVFNVLPCGYEERAGIGYISMHKGYCVYAKMYSSFSDEYSEQKSTKPPTIKGEFYGIKYQGEGGIEWNDVVNAYIGYGSASAFVKDLEKLPKEVVKELLNKIIDMASNLADESLETMLESSEEGLEVILCV